MKIEELGVSPAQLILQSGPKVSEEELQERRDRQNRERRQRWWRRFWKGSI